MGCAGCLLRVHYLRSDDWWNLCHKTLILCSQQVESNIWTSSFIITKPVFYWWEQPHPHTFAFYLWPISSSEICILVIYTVFQKNVPPLACYNFDTHEWISTVLAEMLLIKYAIKKCFIMVPQITCASALSGKMKKHENHIFHSIGLC